MFQQELSLEKHIIYLSNVPTTPSVDLKPELTSGDNSLWWHLITLWKIIINPPGMFSVKPKMFFCQGKKYSIHVIRNLTTMFNSCFFTCLRNKITDASVIKMVILIQWNTQHHPEGSTHLQRISQTNTTCLLDWLTVTERFIWLSGCFSQFLTKVNMIPVLNSCMIRYELFKKSLYSDRVMV